MSRAEPRPEERLIMKFTFEQLKNEVIRIIEENPNNSYKPELSDVWVCRCRYTSGTCSDGSCGCLFGQALLAVGITLEQLRYFDSLDLTITRVLIKLEIIFSQSEKDWLGAIQYTQDQGRSWKSCLRYAANRLPAVAQL